MSRRNQNRTTDGAILEVTHRSPQGERHRPRGQPPAERGLHARSATTRQLRVAIITGAGERFFSPGWDLKAAAAGEESDSDWGVGGFGGLNYPRNLNKPIIAAVNGIACGGGFEVVLGTDIIVMEEHARFALPEINVGVLADAGTDQAAPPHPLPRRRGIPDDGPLDGRRRSQALGPRQPRRAQGRRPRRRRARSRSSSPPARRCCSPPSSSCCVTPKWCPSTRRSSCTTRWTPCSRSSARKTSRKARAPSPKSASPTGRDASAAASPSGRSSAREMM